MPQRTGFRIASIEPKDKFPVVFGYLDKFAGIDAGFQGHLDVKRNILILWKVDNDRLILKTQFREGTYLGIGLNDVANSGMAFAEMVAIGVRSDKVHEIKYL